MGNILGLKVFDSKGAEKHLSYPSDAEGNDLSGCLEVSGSSRLSECDLQARRAAAATAAAAST